MLKFILILQICLLAAPHTARASLDMPEEITELRIQSIQEPVNVFDGITLGLANGSQIRLHQIDIPDHFRPDPGPLAAQAKAVMNEKFQNSKIRILSKVGQRAPVKNRLDQFVAHIENQDDIWAQALLISNGLARVIPDPELPLTTSYLIELEAQARAEKIGLWGNPLYQIHTPETVQESAWHMQIIEGVVKKVATIKNNTYLNFGDDWRKDFTIQINAALRRQYSQDGISLEAFQGQKVQVRGYVEAYNGPLIKLKSPSHLLVLTP